MRDVQPKEAEIAKLQKKIFGRKAARIRIEVLEQEITDIENKKKENDKICRNCKDEMEQIEKEHNKESFDRRDGILCNMACG